MWLASASRCPQCQLWPIDPERQLVELAGEFEWDLDAIVAWVRTIPPIE
jgi:hypothetical protein